MLRSIRLAAALAASLALGGAAARADEQPVVLKPGEGVDIVSSQCAACHSLDYIRMNSPFLSADGWKAEVAKMRTVFGAPVTDAQATAILNYLTQTYGAPRS